MPLALRTRLAPNPRLLRTKWHTLTRIMYILLTIPKMVVLSDMLIHLCITHILGGIGPMVGSNFKIDFWQNYWEDVLQKEDFLQMWQKSIKPEFRDNNPDSKTWHIKLCHCCAMIQFRSHCFIGAHLKIHKIKISKRKNTYKCI